MPAAVAVPAHRRHDISGWAWEISEPLLPGGKGKTARPAQDNRQFINAVCWILRIGAPWRDLPPATETGRTPTAASAAGGTEGCGLGCWRP